MKDYVVGKPRTLSTVANTTGERVTPEKSSSSNKSSFRGVRGIEEIQTRMAALVDWYKKFKPGITEIILGRTDYDLIERWPRAAHTCGFDVTDNGIFYQGFRLTYDTCQGRYVKNADPAQQVIE